MGVCAGLYMCDVVKKFTFAISSPDEFLYKRSPKKFVSAVSVLIILSKARLGMIWKDRLIKSVCRELSTF